MLPTNPSKACFKPDNPQVRALIFRTFSGEHIWTYTDVVNIHNAEFLGIAAIQLDDSSIWGRINNIIYDEAVYMELHYNLLKVGDFVCKYRSAELKEYNESLTSD